MLGRQIEEGTDKGGGDDTARKAPKSEIEAAALQNGFVVERHVDTGNECRGRLCIGDRVQSRIDCGVEGLFFGKSDAAR